MTAPVLFVALPWERKAVLRALPDANRVEGISVPAWTSGAGGVVFHVVQTGMGQESAGNATRMWLAQRLPTAALLLGCAGGLQPSLPAGEVVVADVVLTGTARYECDRRWVQKLTTAAAALPTQAGAILSLDHPLLSNDAKLHAGRETGALAVEMESAAVARECAQAGVPFAAARVILDDVATNVAAERALGVVGLGDLPLELVGQRLTRLVAAIAAGC